MSDDDVYGEFRERYKRAQKRERRSTFLATLLPVLAVIALVLVAGSRLMRTNAELQREIKDRDAVVSTLSQKIDALEKEKGDLQNTLTWVKQEKSTRPQVQAQITQAIDKSGTDVAPTIDLHIAEEDQRDPVRHLQSDYIKSGYLAPGIENVARKGAQIPAETEVRYFNAEDKEEATKIAAQLAKDGVIATPVEVKSNQAEKRKFEVWFAKNAAKPQSE